MYPSYSFRRVNSRIANSSDRPTASVKSITSPLWASSVRILRPDRTAFEMKPAFLAAEGEAYVEGISGPADRRFSTFFGKNKKIKHILRGDKFSSTYVFRPSVCD